MEEEKPWALISEVGGEHGYLEELADIVKQHFQIICYKDFLQNPERRGADIQALLMWKYCPAAEPSLLKLLPSLKVVASGGVGVDHLDVPFINSLGVKVANTPGVVSDATADFTMGLLLASARKILEGEIKDRPVCSLTSSFNLQHDDVRERRLVSEVHTRTDVLSYKSSNSDGPEHCPYTSKLMGVEVTGSTLGIVGMGDVGYKVAQRSKGFEMKILYHNRTKRCAEDEQAVGASYCESLDDLLRRSDFVVIAVTLTPETTGLIGCRELSLMKRVATLVNISRGQVVDQDALLNALQTGAIRAAALDVTHPEPLPRDYPLLAMPNVIITPHIGISTFNTARGIVEKMVENARAAVRGLPVPNEVKPR